MKKLNLILIVLVSSCLILTACSDTYLNVEEESVKSQPEVTALSSNNVFTNGATVNRQTFTVPFPPIPGVEYAPVPAPCLGLDEPLKMSGIWSGWIQTVIIPPGRVHVTERIDYSEITLRLGDLEWHAGPGASETIIRNVPLTADDRGEAAFNVIHEFHARFVSQTDAPDLQVNHRVRQLLGPDGELRKNEFEPFTAKCIGK